MCLIYYGYHLVGRSKSNLVDGCQREELLLILLQLQPELSGMFFDYDIPGRIYP